jgi:hypothetical protein
VDAALDGLDALPALACDVVWPGPAQPTSANTNSEMGTATLISELLACYPLRVFVQRLSHQVGYETKMSQEESV